MGPDTANLLPCTKSEDTPRPPKQRARDGLRHKVRPTHSHLRIRPEFQLAVLRLNLLLQILKSLGIRSFQ